LCICYSVNIQSCFGVQFLTLIDTGVTNAHVGFVFGRAFADTNRESVITLITGAVVF
jgi:hypothetical protein